MICLTAGFFWMVRGFFRFFGWFWFRRRVVRMFLSRLPFLRRFLILFIFTFGGCLRGVLGSSFWFIFIVINLMLLFVGSRNISYYKRLNIINDFLLFMITILFDKIKNWHSHWNSLPISMTRASESEPSDNISLDSTCNCLGCCLSIWSFSFLFITSGLEDIFLDGVSPRMQQKTKYNNLILQEHT